MFKSKQEKEIEKKMLIKKTINSMNKQINALEEQKSLLVEKAKTAKINGLMAQYNLAITGYKMTLLQQRRAQEMLLNFEITSQLKDMTMMTSQFLKGMSSLSKEMANLANEKEFVKVQKQFELALGNVEKQTEQMDMFMETSQESFKSISGETSIVKDKDVEVMVDESLSLEKIDNNDIDEEIRLLEESLK